MRSVNFAHNAWLEAEIRESLYTLFVCQNNANSISVIVMMMVGVVWHLFVSPPTALNAWLKIVNAQDGEYMEQKQPRNKIMEKKLE